MLPTLEFSLVFIIHSFIYLFLPIPTEENPTFWAFLQSRKFLRDKLGKLWKHTGHFFRGETGSQKTSFSLKQGQQSILWISCHKSA